MCQLILASKSPRRQELLKLLGHPYICIPSGVEENTIPGETPESHVIRLSEKKARDVGIKRKSGIIIGSDTIVVLDSDILQKPASPEEAMDMIMRLQARTHTVYTGFALYNATTGKILSGYETTFVTMRAISLELAGRYIETGEPLDKAGAYGIQGYGAALISSVKGCYFNVMGLPLARLMEALYMFTEGEFGYFGTRKNNPDTLTAETHL